MIQQKEIKLPAFRRGYHLITDVVETELAALPDFPEAGLLHILVKHTSAGITLNENVDPAVRRDFESMMNIIVPENNRIYTHTSEGGDDMPAHIKAALIGCEVTIPITGGKMNLGSWQGIYLCEFRDHGGPRQLVLTVYS